MITIETYVHHNAHYEFESAESGRWVTFGDCSMYKFTSKWLCLFGFKIYRLNLEVENLGYHNVHLDDPKKSIYDNN